MSRVTSRASRQDSCLNIMDSLRQTEAQETTHLLEKSELYLTI